MKSYCVPCVLLVMVVIPNLVSAQCITGEMRSHPDLCERYLVCANDVFVEMFCPSGLFFNPELNVCDWPNNVNCTSTWTTTTTPTTTTPTPTTTTRTTTTTTQTTTTTTRTTPTRTTPTRTTPTTTTSTTTTPTTTTPTNTTTTTTTQTTPTTTTPTTTVTTPTTTTTPRTTTPPPPTTTPPPTTVAVPLYRLFHSGLNNHFYTTSQYESNNAVYNLGYFLEGIAGLVSVSPGGCQLVPVYRLLKETNFHNHFYTTSAYEASLAESVHGYKPEGTPFYCAASANICGASTPFYRYNRKSGHHIYTTNISEGDSVIASGGTYEGIMCYIWT